MRLPAVLFACTLALGAYTVNAGSVTGLPPGWALGGEAPQLYAADVDKAGSPSKHEAMVLRRTETSHPYGSAWLAEALATGTYAGKRVHLSMRVRMLDVGVHGGSLFIGFDDGLNLQSFPDSENAEISGKWTTYGYTLILARDIRRFELGVGLKGPGRIEVGDIDLQVVGDAPPDQKGLTIRSDANDAARSAQATR